MTVAPIIRRAPGCTPSVHRTRAQERAKPCASAWPVGRVHNAQSPNGNAPSQKWCLSCTSVPLTQSHALCPSLHPPPPSRPARPQACQPRQLLLPAPNSPPRAVYLPEIAARPLRLPGNRRSQPLQPLLKSPLCPPLKRTRPHPQYIATIEGTKHPNNPRLRTRATRGRHC